jgi:hypothetical protein
VCVLAASATIPAAHVHPSAEKSGVKNKKERLGFRFPFFTPDFSAEFD